MHSCAKRAWNGTGVVLQVEALTKIALGKSKGGLKMGMCVVCV